MRTPAGKECKYFYGNYFRGRHEEECRLLIDHTPGKEWKADLCKSCPVPEIILANACPNMVLHGEVSSGFLGLKRRVKITSYCTKSQQNVTEPQIGCGHCHPELEDIFKK